ncbi:response regulator NasT [Desulfohalotomaculum tongense]|uniref:ANTAR domain-containing response regulator n=1 Tax=Desulforadius tongensis TaxID=1216062 RepID=UPI00195A7131|nr:ANTAR domain-containing protein [Desulforadius tongensis]MBM7856156.1 response regulator NasT [Desulforadius tongensis]
MYDIRVVIIAPGETCRRRLREQLNTAGYIVVADVPDAKKGLRVIFQTQPDVIMISAALGRQVIKIIDEHRIAPVLIISENDSQLVREFKQDCFFGLVFPGMSEFMLDAVIQVAVNNFHKLRELEEEVRKLKRAVEERKIIEKAKGLIMQQKGYSEEKAFRYLRKLSMDRCVPMVKVANAVISSLRRH